MNIYLVSTRGDYLDNEIVVCNKVEEIIHLSFNGDKDNFLDCALITNLSNIEDSTVIFDISRDGTRNDKEILISRLKANGLNKISDYIKANIENIYFSLNFGINPYEQYLNHPIENQEEVKQVIKVFRGHDL